MTTKQNIKPVLVSILELGGYPDFTRLYQSLGFEVHTLESMRKATKFIKKNRVDTIIAEFNFQSDFRDRTSQLETLMACLAQKPEVEVIIFYDKDQQHQFQRVANRFDFKAALCYPLNEDELRRIFTKQ
jgi:DNA-binding NtrC family response regulator